MQTGEAGFNLIRQFESLALQAYVCPAGKLTIGYGHTGDVTPGQQITAADAEALLHRDVARFETAVKRHVAPPLTQNQFDAVVCFAFNVGADKFETSTLCTLLNQQNYPAAADEFLKWNHCHGQVENGLTRRREAERSLFLTPA